MLYMPGKGGDQLNARRLVKLANAFRSYTDQRVSKLGDEGRLADSHVFREALGILFSQEGNNLQDIVLREMARSIDTAGRRLLTDPSMSPLPLLLQGNPALRAQVEALTVEAEDDEIVMDSLTVFLRYLADDPRLSRPAQAGVARPARLSTSSFPQCRRWPPSSSPGRCRPSSASMPTCLSVSPPVSSPGAAPPAGNCSKKNPFIYCIQKMTL